MGEWSDDAYINKYALDDELITLPSLIDKWSSQESNGIKAEDITKHQLEIMHDRLKRITAEASIELRSWPLEKINNKLGIKLDRLTESVYKDLATLHPSVIDFQKLIWRKQHEFYKVKGVRTDMKTARMSMESKSKSLDNLTKLHGQGYFAKDHAKSSTLHEDRRSALRVKAREATQRTLAKKAVINSGNDFKRSVSRITS